MSANWVFQYRREHGKVLAHGRDLERLAEGHGFAMLQDFASLRNGWALAVQGEAEAGIARIQQALANLEAIGARIVRAYHLGLLAEAQARHGRPEEGLALLAEALAEVERRGERCYEAELHRLRGELLLQSDPGNPGGAEACFQKALAVARRQSAKSWELRAATSLARLWQGQGRKSEARELLGGALGWFTEGFDTKDLQEAGALLERLG